MTKAPCWRRTCYRENEAETVALWNGTAHFEVGVMNGAAVILLVLIFTSPQEPRTVKGQYRLPARGFAVVVPADATGVLEGDPEVERGIRIALSSGGNVYVYADMNALEFRTPVEGIRWVTSHHSTPSDCTASAVSDAKVGRLLGAGVRRLCGEKVVRYALAFRPGGGPIYWLRLETDLRNEPEERKAFNRIAVSFRLIRWD